MNAAWNLLLISALGLLGEDAEAFLLHKKLYSRMSSWSLLDSNCTSNETLVLYEEPIIRKGRVFSSLAGRCCPGLPQIEAHKIVGEVCPLAFQNGNFSLPEGFEWAPSNDTACPQNYSRPACCSDPGSGYCNFYHDRTPEGLICLIGKAVCCTGPPGPLFSKVGVPTHGCNLGSYVPGVKKTHKFLKDWMTKDWTAKSKIFNHKFPKPKGSKDLTVAKLES